ncbi:hypothetical protein RB653_008439 [Dictyostelium firmibasis]|uniref:Uncharacterized protein n=1 Tax=Dictyostelium firmibasis TaxID=79012 RepID=A0AAN7YU06_9MYCE
METFYHKKTAHGDFLSSSEGSKYHLIESYINSTPLKVVVSTASFYSYINREDAIKLELKSHPLLIVSHDSCNNHLGIAYICLAHVEILGVQQQVLLRVTSYEKLNMFGNEIRHIFDLKIHAKCFTIKENPQLYKKDYQTFERLLKQNGLTRSDLIPIKDLVTI